MASMHSSLDGRATVGHPVDVASGVLFHEFTDYFLPGRMPLLFRRRYSSALAGRPAGIFGEGWTSPFEMRIRWDLEGYRLLAEDGETEITFDDPLGIAESGRVIRNVSAFHELCHDGPDLVVTRWNPATHDVVRYFFRIGQEGEPWLLRSRQDWDGQGIDVRHDADGRPIELRQRREGRRLQLVYSLDGRVTEVNLITAQVHQQQPPRDTRETQHLIGRYNYDARGRLHEFIDESGNRSIYEYDDTGRMIRELNIGGMMFHFRYDNEGRCIETVGADGFGRTTLEFDKGARLTRVADALDQVTSYHWNPYGQVELEISPLGYATRTAFDSLGRIQSRTRPSGATFSYEYDDQGNRSLVVSPNGATVQYEHNERHQMTCRTDPAGHCWRRTYDEAGRFLGLSNPLGESLTCTYDSRGDLASLTYPSGTSYTFEWDALGHLVAIRGLLGEVVRYEYDDIGRLLSRTDANGQRTTIDVAPSRRDVIFPDGTRRRYVLNIYDQPLIHVDESGATTRWRYSSCGQVVERVDPNGERINLEWSPIPAQLTAIRNEQGARHVFAYDADGRPIRETDLAGRVTQYEYTPDGWVAAIVNAAGERIEIDREPLGAVSAVRYHDGSSVTYEYDVRGFLVKADNGRCPVELQYDAAGRLIREHQEERIVETRYDDRGRRVLRQTSTGHRSRFEHDGSGRLARLTVGDNDPIHFQYDAGGRQIECSLTRGTRTLRAFDGRGRLSEQWISGSSTGAGAPYTHRALLHVFRYDATGNLIELRVPGAPPNTFHYDRKGRIRTAHLLDGRAEQFSFDASDNITSYGCVVPLTPDTPADATYVTGGWHYGRGNQLLEAGSTRFQYDAIGRCIRKVRGSEATSFTWNASGDLASVTLPTGVTWHYDYDAFHRRVRKRGPTGRTTFVWDRDTVADEAYSGGTHPEIRTYWEFGPDDFTPIARIDQRQQLLCFNDPLGTPRHLVGADGIVRWSAGSMRALGAVHESAPSPVTCPVRFPGQWHDSETGLCYNRFRYYDPDIGRYISPDPIGTLGGLNAYTYAVNTTGRIDPYGLSNLPCPLRKKLIDFLKDEADFDPKEEEFFIHGTTEENARDFAIGEGRKLFTTTDPTTAQIFANRTVEKEGGGAPGFVVIIVPRGTAQQLQQQRVLTTKPIDDMPGRRETIFQPGAREALNRDAQVVPLPPGFFDP